jgi:predicted phage terminase large subunit-like protein
MGAALALADAAEIRITPQPGPQTLFFETPADIAVIGGSVFGGKTWSLTIEPLRHKDVPGFSCVTFRRDKTEIRQPGGLWDESLEYYALFGGVPREHELEWRFGPAGARARIKFDGLQYEKDAISWKGAQITLVQFDQLEEFTESQFWYLQSPNRSTCGIRPYTRASCNPLAETWLARFIQWYWDSRTGYSIPERSGVIRWFVRINDVVHWSETTCPVGITGARYLAIEATAKAEMIQRFPASREDKEAPGKFARSFTYILATLDDNAFGNAADPEYESRVRSMSFLEQERLLGVEGRGGNWKIMPAAGLIFNRAMLEQRYFDVEPRCSVVARAWDKAATPVSTANPDPDATAGVKLGKMADGRGYVILDVKHGHWNAAHRNTVMLETARVDAKGNPKPLIFVEQEPGSGGKESAQVTIRDLAGFPVRAIPATTNILERADPLAAQAQAGNLWMVRADWNELVLNELHSFDGSGKGHDDIVSAAALAFNQIARWRQPEVRGAGTFSVWTG